MFSVQFVDVNGDGKKDILASNHEGDGNGGVYAWEVPSAAGKWIKHDLAVGFPIRNGGQFQAAPGGAEAFYPRKGDTGRPHIVVSGDGSQQAYILVPGTTPWRFTTTLLHECAGTVGGIAIGDVNGDGNKEIYIPCYDKGYLVAYSY
jgi:hypothetical protein